MTDLHTVRAETLDVWLERFGAPGVICWEIRWIAKGARGEQPWSGQKWCKRTDEMAAHLQSLVGQLSDELGEHAVLLDSQWSDMVKVRHQTYGRQVP